MLFLHHTSIYSYILFQVVVFVDAFVTICDSFHDGWTAKWLSRKCNAFCNAGLLTKLCNNGLAFALLKLNFKMLKDFLALVREISSAAKCHILVPHSCLSNPHVSNKVAFKVYIFTPSKMLLWIALSFFLPYSKYKMKYLVMFRAETGRYTPNKHLF